MSPLIYFFSKLCLVILGLPLITSSVSADKKAPVIDGDKLVSSGSVAILAVLNSPGRWGVCLSCCMYG